VSISHFQAQIAAANAAECQPESYLKMISWLNSALENISPLLLYFVENYVSDPKLKENYIKNML
jgi:hypothetical protein